VKKKNNKGKGKNNMKKNNKKNSPSTTPTSLPPVSANNNDFKDMLKTALSTYLNSQASNAASKNRELSALAAVVSEFLNSYIILGYTPSGDPVQIIGAHNQQEADSLSAILNKFLFSQSKDDN